MYPVQSKINDYIIRRLYKNYYSTMKYWNYTYIFFNYTDYESSSISVTLKYGVLLNILNNFFLCNPCTFFAFEIFAENFRYKCNKFSLCVDLWQKHKRNRYIRRLAILCCLFTVSHEVAHLCIIYCESKFQQKSHTKSLQLHILVCKRSDFIDNVTISDTDTASLKKHIIVFWH